MRLSRRWSRHTRTSRPAVSAQPVRRGIKHVRRCERRLHTTVIRTVRSGTPTITHSSLHLEIRSPPGPEPNDAGQNSVLPEADRPMTRAPRQTHNSQADETSSSGTSATLVKRNRPALVRRETDEGDAKNSNRREHPRRGRHRRRRGTTGLPEDRRQREAPSGAGDERPSDRPRTGSQRQDDR